MGDQKNLIHPNTPRLTWWTVALRCELKTPGSPSGPRADEGTGKLMHAGSLSVDAGRTKVRPKKR
jgi:hypothetical protein